ncbi:rab11 family-interacting protein 5 [Gastrophryne carolinensis]
MFLRPEPELGWLPTHVQVTILQAKGLRAKGKHGTSDAYTLIQVGKEKYSTSVVEKTSGSPEWKEECSFELSPGALERGENCDLLLTIMHRALIGLDQFLGQVSIPLHQIYQEGRSLRNQWYKLRSKPGKKEKERGEIQVSIQFTRNNLTASMFDLSIKDKPKTPFGKLKEKMKVKKLLESSSAIVPSSMGRLDSDDEDEKKPKSKAAAFFKGRLRKSSLTKSNTSLGSDSTASSTSVTVPTTAGISIVLPDASKKPVARNSSLSTEPYVVEHESSPRMTHKRAFSDEVGQVKMFPEPKTVQNLKPKSSPISKSSVCINGSHVYTEVPPPKPSPSLEISSLASRSFQNIMKKAEESAGPEVLIKHVPTTERQESKPATTPMSAHENSPKPKALQPKVEAKPVQITSPMFIEEASNTKGLETMAREEKAKDSPQHGPGNHKMVSHSAEDPRPRVPSSSEGRNKVGGWFGSKDTPQKPSFPSGPVATSEAAERGSSLVEKHSPSNLYMHEDQQKSSLYQKGAGSGEVFGHHVNVSSPSLETVPEWEEQFDAFASSRLQKSPETKESFLPENKPLCVSFDGHSIGQNVSQNDHLIRPSLEELNPSWSNTEKVSETTSDIAFPTRFFSNVPTSSIAPFASGYITNQKQSEHRPSMERPAPSLDPKTFNFVETSQKEIRVASVSPCLIKDQNLVKLNIVMPNIETPLQEHAQETIDSTDLVVDEVKALVKPRHQALIEHNFVKLGEDRSPEPNEKTRVEEIVNELIREQAIMEDIGSLALSKPLRPMLSTAIERIEFDADNCKQTSFQDTTRKQTVSPEEHKVEQNMVESKQSISPVASCPIIEVRSPVLGYATEDAQSTAEGPLTNLREGNNEFTKPGSINGEHLLDVNDTTAAEQFRTCPSNVSLDFSSLPENSNKLEIINHSPSQPLSPLGGNKLNNEEDFVFQKPKPLPKKLKSNRTEGSCVTKTYDHSDVFWSALEEQRSPNMPEPENRPNANLVECNELTRLDIESKIESKDQENNGFISHLVDSHSPPPNHVPNDGLESKVNLLLEDGRPGYSLSQQSSWSADIVVDFKNEEFWKTDSDQLAHNEIKSIPSPGNPFTPTDKTPRSPMNPFVDLPKVGMSYESVPQEDLSFKDLHERAAIRGFPSAVLAAPFVPSNQPLAFSTPFIAAAPNPNPSNFLSPIRFSTASGVATTASTHTATLSYLHSPAASGVTSPAPAVMPQETQPTESLLMPLKISPHPVKPISATLSDPAPDKKTPKPALSIALSSGLEKLKSVTTGQPPTPKKQDPDRFKDFGSPDAAAKYYHLTHDELIQRLIQREAELERKETHMQELEEYIDKLLVRIMDQAPALLQAPLETTK